MRAFFMLVVGCALVLAAGCWTVDAPEEEEWGLDEGVEDAAWEEPAAQFAWVYDGDPGDTLTCVAPDRDEYKAAHGLDPEGNPLDEVTADGFEPGPPSKNVPPGMEHTILFVFDKSGSMADPWDERDKWHVANDAMVGAVSQFQSYLSAGAIFFPTDDDCGVAPITDPGQIIYRSGSAYLSKWESMMDQYYAAGGTPLIAALAKAHEALVHGCNVGVLDRPIKVVLLTDGEPNCWFDDNLMTMFPAIWLEHGVETHVIGLPGSESALQKLEAIAHAGGTEPFILPSSDDPDESAEDFEDEMVIVCE